MIKPLRKRHLQIWSILLVMLPLIIFFGRLAVPIQANSALLQPNARTPLPIILKTIDRENYTVRIRADVDSSPQQLEWINKNALTTPTAVIYRISTSSDNMVRELIGRIEARGTYHFALKKDSSLFKQSYLLYDFIHDKNIDTLNF